MPARTSFGKRDLPRAAMPRAAGTRASAAATTVPAGGTVFDDFYSGGIPVLTCGLIGLLVLIFAAEIRLTPDAAHTLSPGRQALMALGGIDGRLVLGWGEGWCFSPAPLPPASLSHLLGNCVALSFAGLFLEPVIGAGWFGVLFF